MELRALNESGFSEGARLLDAVRQGEVSAIPRSFLEDDSFAETVGSTISAPRKGELATRWQLGLWLYRMLEGVVDARDVFNLPGMWSWLAFYLFDIICPIRDGQRKVVEDAKYLLTRGDYRKSYRHLVSGPYFIIRAHIDSPSVVKALLNNAPDSPGEIYEQLAARKQIITSNSAMRVANAMYWDEESKKVKRGAAGAGAASARRYANILMQYDVTYDLYAITEERLRALLPAEFDRFLRSRT